MTGGGKSFSCTWKSAGHGKTVPATVRPSRCPRGPKRAKPIAAIEKRKGDSGTEHVDASSSLQELEIQRCWEAANRSSETSTSGRYDEFEEGDCHDDMLTPLPSAAPSDTLDGGALPALRPSDFNFNSYVNSHYLPNFSQQQQRIEDLQEVYVILFGEETSPAEGIYSLRAISREDNLPKDTIIAFVDLVDAERYSGLLEATMQHVPHVYPIEPKELMSFCAEAGYHCRLEPRGSLLIPPDYNVGITDWERLCSLRLGKYTVLDKEPDYTSRPAEWGVSGPSAQPSAGSLEIQPAQLWDNAGLYDPSYTWEEDLDKVRNRLERLLAREDGESPQS